MGRASSTAGVGVGVEDGGSGWRSRPGRLPGGGVISCILTVAESHAGQEVGGFLSEEMALPSPLGRDVLAARPFLPRGSRGSERPSPAPERGGCSRAFDCCRRRWPGPRARLRITQAPGKRGCPHALRGRCSPASHAGLPKPASRSAARTHAGLHSTPASPSSWQAPGVSGGAGWARAWGRWLTCSPWAPRLSSCLRARVVGFWAPFTSARPGRVRFHRDKATQPCTGCLGLRRNSRVVNVLFMASS